MQANIILASSEHSFPYRLGNSRLGFNTADLTQFIYAGEVPPDKMYELLTTKWGIGHNLAVTLIDHYGGHVYDTLLKLKELNSMGDSFEPGIQMQADSVLKCLKFDGDKPHMRELLTQIAEKGFAPLKDKEDREAEIISKNNVGGQVQKDRAMVIGFPADKWGKYKMGLIPSKQSIRLVIAEVLEKNSVLEAAKPQATVMSPTDKEISRVEIKIEKVEAEIEKSTDLEEKKLLRKKEELLRKKEELLREERLILLRRQDSSNK